jgi:hypothetical protein
MAPSRSSKEAGARLNGPPELRFGAVSSTAARHSRKGLRSLPVVFVDKATEAVAAHDRPSGSCDVGWRSALGYSEIETAVGTFSVVVIEIRLQHRFEVAFTEEEDPVSALGANGPDRNARHRHLLSGLATGCE